jgi:hypothetical protein
MERSDLGDQAVGKLVSMLGRKAFRSLKAATTLLLCAAAVAVGFASEARAFCRMKINSADSDKVVTSDTCHSAGIALAWKKRCISYAVSKRILIDEDNGQTLGPNSNPPYQDVVDMVNASFRTWTDILCDGEPVDLEIEQLPEPSECSEPQQNLEGPNVNSIAFVWDWEERGYDDNAFAVTSVFANTKSGEILGVDMELNETQGNLGDCCPNGLCRNIYCFNHGIVDIQNVITHEAGHFFGLGHSNVKDASMYSQAEVGETSKRALQSDDIEGFCSIYPAGSLSQECDFAPPGGLSLTCYESNRSNIFGCTAGEPGIYRRPGATALSSWACVLVLLAITRRRRRSEAGAFANGKRLDR